MSVTIQLRRGTVAQWTTANTVLAIGELGLCTDTGQFKIGDGTTPWAGRPYGGIQGPAGADSTVAGPQGNPGNPGPPGTTDYNNLTNKPTLGTAAAQNTGAFATAAQGTDSRTPLAHTHAPSEITGTAVVTADARLSDARTPTAHTHPVGEVTGLGTAATTAASAYATAAQGALAATALQSVPAGTSAATSATTGTMTVSMTTDIITITPTGACTFNASGGAIGKRLTFIVTTAGTSSFVLTFGTNFRKAATLATGTVSARFFSVTFINVNGTIWQEDSRTPVLS